MGKINIFSLSIILLILSSILWCYAADTIAPTAIIDITPSSPLSAGEVKVTVTTSEKVVKVPTPLRFTDASGKDIEITLTGTAPGVSFTGTLTVTSDVAEGKGIFFFDMDAMEDEAGNTSNRITSGNTAVIDITAPLIISVIFSQGGDGIVKITIQTNEELSAASIVINNREYRFTASSKKNESNNWSYSYDYAVPVPGLEKIPYTIKAQDLAGNSSQYTGELTESELTVFAPTAKIELSDPSPTKAGDVTITLTTSKELNASISEIILIFTDAEGKTEEVKLTGSSTRFSGIWTVSSQAEGNGSFTFKNADALRDEKGNAGHTITSGAQLRIDMTPPQIGGVSTNPGGEGILKISWEASEKLSDASLIIINKREYKFTATGREKMEGGWDYSFNYNVPQEGLRKVLYTIKAVDLADNEIEYQGELNESDLAVFAPTARLEFSDPSPIKAGTVTVKVKTSKELEPSISQLVLMFNDVEGKGEEILLSGSGAIFSGTWTVSNQAEGEGIFSFNELALKDIYGNSGSTITDGSIVRIDLTPPTVTNFSTSRAGDGIVKINFQSDEKLSDASVIMINNKEYSFTSTGRENTEGGWDYSYSYSIPTSGLKTVPYTVKAIDMADNEKLYESVLSELDLSVFAPTAIIVLSDPSPVKAGDITVKVITSKSLSETIDHLVLIFTDAEGHTEEIVVTGQQTTPLPPFIKGETTFTGIWTVGSQAEGKGVFSFKHADELKDLSGNSGSKITDGDIVQIDLTSPSIISVTITPSSEGRLKISVTADEQLFLSNTIEISNKKRDFTSEVDNGDGTWTYSYEYGISQGEGGTPYNIHVVDLAGNSTDWTGKLPFFKEIDTFAPKARVTLNKTPPISKGDVTIYLSSTEILDNSVTSLTLLFTDQAGIEHNILLSGYGTNFSGIWNIDTEAEGEGTFTLQSPLIDLSGNIGYAIIGGDSVTIDFSSPQIMEVYPVKGGDGIVKLKLKTNEELSSASAVVINNREYSFTSSGKENLQGYWDYSFNYTVPSAGLKSIAYTIKAIDLALNESEYHGELTEKDLQLFAPSAKILLSDPSPTKGGQITVTVITSKELDPTIKELHLIFTDAKGIAEQILLKGEGSSFSGIWIVDTEAEGEGYFSFRDADELIDSLGNSGSRITEGDKVIIDLTPPSIISVSTSLAGDGTVRISIQANEELDYSSAIVVNNREYSFTASGKENLSGGWDYSFNYSVPSSGLKTVAYGIKAIDLALNESAYHGQLTEKELQVFVPTAKIWLSDPSPTKTGEVTVRVTTSRELDLGIKELRLIFTDALGVADEILLSGLPSNEVKGSKTTFTGIWKVDTEAEGEGFFSFKSASELRDSVGNSGSKITDGDTVEIDKTAPLVSNIFISPAGDGIAKISFDADSELSSASMIVIDKKEFSFTLSGRKNNDGGFSYHFNYRVPEEGLKTISYTIKAIDLADNENQYQGILTEPDLAVFAPTAKIELSDPSPTKKGTVTVKLTTSKELDSGINKLILVFVDAKGITYEILLSGSKNNFNGIWDVGSQSEGEGSFSFKNAGELRDEKGNAGSTITDGKFVKLDFTAPSISNVTTSQAGDGIVKISFQTDEKLSNASAMVINLVEYSFALSGRENAEGGWDYNISYKVPSTGLKHISYQIKAVDLADNEIERKSELTESDLAVFAPTAGIELSDPSPTKAGDVTIKVITSRELNASITFLTLVFTDAKGNSEEILLTKTGANFTGTWAVDTEAEGMGTFSFKHLDELVDAYGNSGSVITEGDTVNIDLTAPTVNTVSTSQAGSGIVKINFNVNEQLSSASSIIFSNGEHNFTSTGRKNDTGGFSYSFSYSVPSIGLRTIPYTIKAIDLADNKSEYQGILTEADIAVFAPAAKIKLSDPSPVKAGKIEVEVTTSKKLNDNITKLYLIFTDAAGNSEEITLLGSGVLFKGIWIVENQAEGKGSFSFKNADELQDSLGNSGSQITEGDTVEIDLTPPTISNVFTSPAGDGIVKISFQTDEELSISSVILINKRELAFTDTGVKNAQGGWDYHLNYTIPTIGLKNIPYTINVIDLADNENQYHGQMTETDLIVFAPTAIIQLSDPSPTKGGIVTVFVITSREIVPRINTLTLIFTDANGETEEILLAGSKNSFSGAWEVKTQAEGEGKFSFKNADALKDLQGNSGSRITDGDTVEIDLTAPKLFNFSTSPAGDGTVKIAFQSDEELSIASAILINKRGYSFASKGKKNDLGGWDYSFDYTVPSAGLKSIAYTIKAVDLALNESEYNRQLTEKELQVFAPSAKILLSDPSPTKAGEVTVTVITSKELDPTIKELHLIFTDAKGVAEEILLLGERNRKTKSSVTLERSEGEHFSGIWTVDTEAEGEGYFSFRDADELRDSLSNSGSRITEGDKVIIDLTPPSIISVSTSSAGDGIVKISFQVDEKLSASSSIVVNNKEYSFTASGKENLSGGWDYSFNYSVPSSGLKTVAYGIKAIDLALNESAYHGQLTEKELQVFAPTAKIFLSDPSPTKGGQITVTVTTSKELDSTLKELHLIFTDAKGKTEEITVYGSAVAVAEVAITSAITSFVGIWNVDTEADGEGKFSFKRVDELSDSFGNSGSQITEGDKVIIDMTSPSISDITTSPSGDGIVKISFDADEQLSLASKIIINKEEFSFTQSGKENIKGGWSYHFNYKVKESGLMRIDYIINAVDLADNERQYQGILTESDLQIFAPSAKISLSDPSPTKAGAVLVKVTTSKPVVKKELNLVFTDAEGKSHFISARSPQEDSWTYFEGIWVVDSKVAEGKGAFSFRDADELSDTFGNSGSRINLGREVEIDITPPDSEVIVTPAGEGILKISFITNEQLLLSSTVEISTKKYNFTSEIDNGDGTWTYSLRYIMSQGEERTPYKIHAIDLAGNSTDFLGTLPEIESVDVFAPSASIELSDPSPIGKGETIIYLTTSEILEDSIRSLTLIFTDSAGRNHNIPLTGSGTKYQGRWKIEKEAEGKGTFTISTAMVDLSGNRGYTITSGNTVEIDLTPPKIKDIKAIPNPAKAGPIAIVFNVSEQLSGDSTITINEEVFSLTAKAIANADDTYTYTHTYLVPSTEGVKEANIVIKAVDSAGNQTVAKSRFQIDAESPIASIELLQSPKSYAGITYTGIVGLKIITSEPIVAVPTPLIFTDYNSISFEIKLNGNVPGTIFTGTFVVNDTVAEGVGRFFFHRGALQDIAGNRGDNIISGSSTTIEHVAGLGGWAAPNPFTPTGNGDETDKTIFHVVNVPPGASVEIRIYDITGRPVRKLTDLSSWEWNGKNERGEFVEGGLYIFQIRAGKEHVSGTVVVIR